MSENKLINSSHPLMVAWEGYKKTFEYKNSRKWAQTSHVDGSMWAAFAEGWKAAARSRLENSEEKLPDVDPNKVKLVHEGVEPK